MWRADDKQNVGLQAAIILKASQLASLWFDCTLAHPHGTMPRQVFAGHFWIVPGVSPQQHAYDQSTQASLGIGIEHLMSVRAFEQAGKHEQGC